MDMADEPILGQEARWPPTRREYRPTLRSVCLVTDC
jgi:hypothetical protein